MKEHTKRYVQRNGKNTRKHIKSKKGINDQLFQIGKNKQASEYETTAEFIIYHIKRTSETLRTLKNQNTESWMPILKMSVAIDQKILSQENKQYKLEYKVRLEQAMKRIDQYDKNLHKTYVFLLEKCSRAMQNKIAGRKEYDTEIYNDPIKLLIAIK